MMLDEVGKNVRDARYRLDALYSEAPFSQALCCGSVVGREGKGESVQLQKGREGEGVKRTPKPGRSCLLGQLLLPLVVMAGESERQANIVCPVLVIELYSAEGATKWALWSCPSCSDGRSGRVWAWGFFSPRQRDMLGILRLVQKERKAFLVAVYRVA